MKPWFIYWLCERIKYVSNADISTSGLLLDIYFVTSKIPLAIDIIRLNTRFVMKRVTCAMNSLVLRTGNIIQAFLYICCLYCFLEIALDSHWKSVAPFSQHDKFHLNSGWYLWNISLRVYKTKQIIVRSVRGIWKSFAIVYHPTYYIHCVFKINAFCFTNDEI